MAKIRVGRVGEQIKKEISQIIQSELKDPRIGFITVTGVDVTNDFSQAKVYLSVLGSDEQKQETLKALGRSSGFIRASSANGSGCVKFRSSCSNSTRRSTTAPKSNRSFIRLMKGTRIYEQRIGLCRTASSGCRFHPGERRFSGGVSHAA